MKKLSVVIPTYNVEDIINRCLDSLTWADEIIVVDMFSTDKTKEICESYYNVKFYQNKDYIFANLNYGIERATGDWIMRHDSDEVITPELRDEIQEVLSQEDCRYDGFYIAEKTFYFGKWFSFDIAGKSGRPKLFKKGYLRHECKSEHEYPIITGKWGYLNNIYLHYSHPTISGWISKMNYYSERDIERIERINPKKFSWYRWLLGPVKAFYHSYVKGKAYRYGYHGLVLSMLWTFYNFIQRAKLWELYEKRKKLDSGTVRQWGSYGQNSRSININR